MRYGIGPGKAQYIVGGSAMSWYEIQQQALLLGNCEKPFITGAINVYI